MSTVNSPELEHNVNPETRLLCDSCRGITLSRLRGGTATHVSHEADRVPFCLDVSCFVGKSLLCAEIRGRRQKDQILDTFPSLQTLRLERERAKQRPPSPKTRKRQLHMSLLYKRRVAGQSLDLREGKTLRHPRDSVHELLSLRVSRLISNVHAKQSAEPGQLGMVVDKPDSASASSSNSASALSGTITDWCPIRVAADADPYRHTRSETDESSRVIRSAMAPETLVLVKDWLRECDGVHKHCSQDMDGQPHPELPVLPTRVVDLGPPGTWARPRLFLSKGARAKYAALSHRWPETPGMLARRDNIETLQTEIPSDALSKIFLGAIAITRALGLRYLWVDCLCIVQDDRADWEAEAQKMGSFYEQAYVTIAATAGAASTAGSLGQGPTIIPLPCDAQNPQMGTFFLTEPGYPDPQLHVEKSQLNRRGWVLQERLLSRRVLHLAADQVYWECRQHAVSQSGSIFQPRSSVDFFFPLPGLMNRLRAVKAKKGTVDADSEFLQIWMTIIEYYSACEFTFDTDRLPAIFGLADRLSPLTTRKYVTGNWFAAGTSEVPLSLLWTACGGAKNKPPSQPRAASWCWASIEGEITFYNLRHKIEAQLLGIKTPSETTADFEELHIRGRMLVAEIDLDEVIGRAESKVHPLLDKTRQQSIGHITFDLAAYTASTVTCLYLFTDFTGYPVFMGLQKVPQPNNNSSEPFRYRRVGMGSLLQGRTGAFKDEREILLV